MEETLHPSPDEIKPYVAVGPSPELSITVTKETFDTGFIVITIIFVLVIVATVFLLLFLAHRVSELPPPPPPLTRTRPIDVAQTNLGAAVTATRSVGTWVPPNDGVELTSRTACLANENTKWTGDHCACLPPFFGPTCSLERHDKDYFAVGIPNESTLGINIIRETTTKNKSFSPDNEETCSHICNETPDCIGFLYRNGYCGILGDNVVIPANEGISYSENTDSTLYLKSSEQLHFTDRVFLGQYSYSFPPRYWLVKETPYFKQLKANNIATLQFFPEHIIIDYNLTGLYCTFPFEFEDVEQILQRGETNECYIHNAGTPLQVPRTWRYKLPLYVVYI